MSDSIDTDDIKTFDWKELHGKTVSVIVYEEDGVQISSLYEAESKEFFVVSIKTIGGNHG